MYERILVGVDGSEQGKQALEKAIDLAEKHQSELIIAHVIDARNIPNSAEVYSENLWANWVEGAKDILAEGKKQAEAGGVSKVETVLSSGNPRSQLSKELVLEHHADLLITAATGRNRIERMFTGSVAEASIRRAPSDYLIVKEAEGTNTAKPPYKKIMVAVDGSEQADHAFMQAIELTKLYETSLVIVHVVETEMYFSDVSFHNQSFVLEAEEKAENMLAAYKEKAEARGVKEVKTALGRGNPRVQIAESLTHDHRPDLIITGATGRNRVERILVGSVAEATMRAAPCDVLSIKTTEEKESGANAKEKEG